MADATGLTGVPDSTTSAIQGTLQSNIVQVQRDQADNAAHGNLLLRNAFTNATLLNLANAYRIDSESGSGAARLMPQTPMPQAAPASKPAGT